MLNVNIQLRQVSKYTKGLGPVRKHFKAANNLLATMKVEKDISKSGEEISFTMYRVIHLP